MTNTTEFKIMLIRYRLTAADLAEKIGLSPQSMSQKMNNVREFTLSELQKIRDAVNLSPAEIYKIFFTSDGE